MTIKYHLVQSDEASSITAILNGKPYVADGGHTNWTKIVTAIVSSDDTADESQLARLFDPAEQAQDYFSKVSERVSISGGHVFLDGDEIDGGLSNHIARYIGDNDESKAQPLVNFLENVMTNPNEHSREQLYDWLSRYDFAITDEGNFLAYKGVVSGSSADGYPYQSSSSGTAIVDGKKFSGRIPNKVGAVVEMPRTSVQHDPSVGCHTGLHAGTWEYASTFTTGPVLLVEINPRDVVSVPTDCDWQKIRTCRYTVKEVITSKLDQSYYGNAASDVELDEDYSADAPFEGDEDESWY